MAGRDSKVAAGAVRKLRRARGATPNRAAGAWIVFHGDGLHRLSGDATDELCLGRQRERVHREKRHHTAAIVGQAAAVLAQGDCLALFPEGTTTNGLRLRAFHPSLFQVAVDHGGAIALVSIRYVFKDGGLDTAPAYCDDITMPGSMRAILARRKIIAEVNYFDTIEVQGKTRRVLCSEAEKAIATALNLPIPHKGSEKPVDPPSEAQSADLPTDSPYPAPHADSPH